MNHKLLEYLRTQFAVSQSYAAYWGAMATTGAATMRDTAQGREATPEEKAQGITLGFRDHTDQEKISNALQTMHRHIHRMSELSELIAEEMGKP